MWSRTSVMVSSLALLGVLRALTIDNQLQIIKNDCYERLAIGQRLNPKDVYKASHVSTVLECQLVCTKEKEVCKSFSFGIGLKGNATCELSTDLIKETADLKPIGTKIDTDFDLYIKKLGCTLVIDPHIEPAPPYESENTLEYGITRPLYKPSASYNNYETNSNVQHYPKPQHNDYNNELQHVQTLVSVSSGPQKPLLHPIHEILVEDRPYSHPPFRPGALNSPYEQGPRPGYGSKPFPDKYGSFISRPENYDNDYHHRPKPGSDDKYGDSHTMDDYNQRPYKPSYANRPTNDYNHKPNNIHNPPVLHPSGYEDRPSRPNNYKPYKPSEYFDRPYGVHAHKPFDSIDSNYNNRFPEFVEDYNAKPIRPDTGYNDRPNPSRPNSNYNPSNLNIGYNDQPSKPNENDYNNRPLKPMGSYNEQRPIYEYDQRPNDYDNKPNSDYLRPVFRPESSIYNNPNLPTNVYGDKPNKPHINADYDRKPLLPSNDYDSKPNPSNLQSSNEYLQRPDVDRYDTRPQRPSNNNNYQKPENTYGNSEGDKYDRPVYENNRPNKGQHYDNPNVRPGNTGSYEESSSFNKPNNNNYETTNSKPNNAYNSDKNGYNNDVKDQIKNPNGKPIVTQSLGPYGESITSIITELENACFRRVLAGKRVTRALVKKAVWCERVEDCQKECAEEKRFLCEGFNYRLDPSGRGKGDCELLNIPLSHLDIGRDLYPDRDYDYYERDRNAARGNCGSQNYDYYENKRYDRRPNYDGWYDKNYNGQPRPDYGHARRPQYYDYESYGGNRRGDFDYHESSYHQSHHDHRPAPPFDDRSYEPYLPQRWSYHNQYDKYDKFNEKDKIKNHYWSYGTNYNPQDFEKRNYYLPPSTESNKNWGQYGGSYGNGGLNLEYNGYGHSQNFDFWGLNKYEEKKYNYGSGGGGYLPLPPLSGGRNYLPSRPSIPNGNYLPSRPPSNKNEGPYLPSRQPSGSYLPENSLQTPYKPPKELYKPPSYLPVDDKNHGYNNAILPAEPRYPYYYDFLKDECSLRSATGFRLTKGIVKKLFAVPDIYECERLCFAEKDFPCASYAYRYGGDLSGLNQYNCYLSNKNYKELDYYTDIEPDRNFDIYTMNNMKKCEQPIVHRNEYSECFWRVRSGQRLDHKVVRDSLTVKSVVECQIECLKAVRFTCRAYSFRYGSPVIGSTIDNCQLTDWPFYELDPRKHFVYDPGFELYERGSFGHGCEPNHFTIRKPWPQLYKEDQLCYVGFGSPARLLPQATRKELYVDSEEECKTECSKLRESTLFQCMSFSYSNKQNSKWRSNCQLSDILQRDLIPHVDYEPDANSWLFAWDNYNPECLSISYDLAHTAVPQSHRNWNDNNALDTWRIYSVSGWPCRRGSLCRQNREAGFWYCNLEGGDSTSWDYCCRPDHQCGYSQHYSYQWCYVGPTRTQWRKCNDRYYPYLHNYIDRFDTPPNNNHFSERPQLAPLHPPIRPNRPPAPPTAPPPRPSLDEYEIEFENQFLDPPKPGGFGQSRRWPVMYLHNEMPPNATDGPRKFSDMSDPNPKFAAIQNLIDVIKSNDLKNVQYQITNETNTKDDVLFVRIPLPTNFTGETSIKKSENLLFNATVIDLDDETKNKNDDSNRSQKSLPIKERSLPVYRRAFITRTNVTRNRRTSRKL